MAEELGGPDDSFFDSIFEEIESSAAAAGSFIEDSFSSFIAVHASTPVKGRESTITEVRPGPSRRSKASSVKERLPCDICKSTFANERTLAVHKKMHAMKGATARIPDREFLKTFGRGAFQEVLEEILEEEAETGGYPELATFCKHLMELPNEDAVVPLVEFYVDLFLKATKSQNALLPSALRSSLYTNSNYKSLCSEDIHEECFNMVCELYVLPKDIFNLYFGVSVAKFSEKCMAFVLRQMRGGEGELANQLLKQGSDKLDSVDFQQTVHYITGFILSGFIHKGQRSKQDSLWTLFLDTINRKFLSRPGNECNVNVCSYSQRRGTEED